MNRRQAWKIYRNKGGHLVRGHTLALAQRVLRLSEPAFWPYSKRQGKAFLRLMLLPTITGRTVLPPEQIIETPMAPPRAREGLS